MTDDLLLMVDDEERERFVREGGRVYRVPRWWPFVWFGIAFVAWLVFAAWIGFPALAVALGTLVLVALVYRTYR